MNIFDDLQAQIGCKYVSELHSWFRQYPKNFLQTMILLTYKPYAMEDWIDLFYYLQLPFSANDISSSDAIRRYLYWHIDHLEKIKIY